MHNSALLLSRSQRHIAGVQGSGTCTIRTRKARPRLWHGRRLWSKGFGRETHGVSGSGVSGCEKEPSPRSESLPPGVMPPLGVDDDRWNAEGALIGDAGACNGEFIGELPATAPEMWLSASDAGPSLILRASDFEIVKNLKATTTICRRRVVFDPFPSPTMPRRRTPLAAGEEAGSVPLPVVIPFVPFGTPAVARLCGTSGCHKAAQRSTSFCIG